MGYTIRSASTWALALAMAFAMARPVGAQSASVSVSARASAAIKVPRAAFELRAAGVPEAEVRTALVAVHHHHVPAPEVHTMLRKSVRVVHVHGPIPRFGSFVRVKLGKGLRGPKLHKSIRIEHERFKGHGPPPHAKGWAKGHHKARGGPPGHRGKVDVRVRGGGKPRGPKGSVRVRGKAGKGGGNVRRRGKPSKGGGNVRGRGGRGGGGGGPGRGGPGHGRGKH